MTCISKPYSLQRARKEPGGDEAYDNGSCAS